MSALKKIIHDIVLAVVTVDPIWRFLAKGPVRLSQYVCAVRTEHEVERTVGKYPGLSQALSGKRVLSGPFAGLKYGDTKAFCSALYPKLLGSYENEISGDMIRALSGNDGLMVDVGAADGYYAVGFAWKRPDTQVIAFEQDARARGELRKLAHINGVEERITLKERCERSDLMGLPAGPGLMIMDCEGYEEVLLDREVIAALKDWTFIIETHDGFSPGLTGRLTENFAPTHAVATREVIHDLNKADHFHSPELEGVSRRDQDALLAENRHYACLRWMICEPLYGKSGMLTET